jgi:hypothetical protein
MTKESRGFVPLILHKEDCGMSTVETVLRHLIPALEAIRADLERERRAVPI